MRRASTLHGPASPERSASHENRHRRCRAARLRRGGCRGGGGRSPRERLRLDIHHRHPPPGGDAERRPGRIDVALRRALGRRDLPQGRRREWSRCSPAAPRAAPASSAAAPRATRAPASWSTRKGDIVTNYHVVENARLGPRAPERRHELPRPGHRPERRKDVAVIRISAPHQRAHAAHVRRLLGVQVGDSVVAIGDPYGLRNTARRAS